MSVKDMIKKSVLESDNFVQSVSWDTMSGIIINMLLAVVLGVCITLYTRGSITESSTAGLTH